MSDNIYPQNLNVEIISSSNVCDINVLSWEKLACHSKYVNPYYEHWNLIPAITHLSKNKEIKIITVFDKNILVALFPIEISRRVFPSSFKLWQHPHCYDSSPLILNNINFDTIIELALHKLNAQYCQINLHQGELFHSKSNRFSHAYQRAYINETSELNRVKNSGKLFRENSRLLRILNKDYELHYIEHNDAIKGIQEYAELESHSWKMSTGGAIYSRIETKQYYQALAKNGDKLKNFHFQKLKANNKTIAMAMRIESRDCFFEIKTSFHNDFKKYAPGKILEFKILESLSHLNNICVDSCTHHDNALINRLWPNKKVFYRSTVFSSQLKSKIFKFAYMIKRLHQRYSINFHV